MIQPDQIIRSKRKTLSISIDSLGRLVVRAPYACKLERIFSFIEEKESWILRAKERRKTVKLPIMQDLSGYTFSFLGEDLTISLHSRKGYQKEEGFLFLDENNPRKALDGFFLDEAKRVLIPLVGKRAKELGVSFRKIAIGRARTRWGSCSKDGALRFSFRVLYCPLDVIDYVVVHELCHRKVYSHKPTFWTEVQRFLPDYKNKRKWLKENAHLMQIF